MQYLREYQTFVGTARYWTESFAKASSLGVEEKVCIPYLSRYSYNQVNISYEVCTEQIPDVASFLTIDIGNGSDALFEYLLVMGQY